MYDKKIYCVDALTMVNTAKKTIYDELGKLKFVNLKYKLKNESESGWFYDVNFSTEGNSCIINFPRADRNNIILPLERLEYFKLRPYYVAACVGFKNIIFFSYKQKEE